MKFFKRLGAATGVMALLVSGLVGFATPAQAAIISDVGSNKGSYTVNWADAVREGFEGIYAKSQIQGGYALWSDADCLESVRLMVDKDKFNKKSYVVDEAGTQEFPKSPQGGTTGWCYISLNLAPKDQCAEIGGKWENDFCWKEVVDIEWPSLEGQLELDDSLDLPSIGVGGLESDGQLYTDVVPFEEGKPSELHVEFTYSGGVTEFSDGVTKFWGIPVPADGVDGEPVQKAPPPPPCWSAEALNNCPVGGALRFAAPKYAMVGVPVTMYAYASWRPDANSPAQPTNGSAVIRVDGEDYSGVEFKDGVAEWRFIPETEGMKEFTASGVLFSGLSGANAYIDTVEARTYVLEYDPAAYATALKKKAVEIGDTYVITDPNQARSYLEDRYEWSVSEKSDDVCAVYETKKGAVKAKFTDSGKCTVIWLDKESEESGKYTFIAKK